jgi:putative hydrolase of the HAD superfamily
MLPDRRAVVFDLDDTLYPYRRFRVSGFAAAAAHLSVRTGLDARLGFRAMHRASRGVSRGRELQAALVQHDLPLDLAAELIDVMRHHHPRLRLPRSTARLLHALRRDGWRLGVLTNGQPSIQARKVQALGLEPFVDAIVFAAGSGSGAGKPAPEAFAAISRQLEVPARQSIFAGDDERCDVEGARRAGFATIRVDAWTRPTAPTVAHACARALSDIPSLVHRLAEEAPVRHAA